MVGKPSPAKAMTVLKGPLRGMGADEVTVEVNVDQRLPNDGDHPTGSATEATSRSAATTSSIHTPPAATSAKGCSSRGSAL